ncbi:MAG TPA: argininosuccinate lyase [Saprospiraceae bacterium]|nr:argininosuccinate lyase [Saprospiraceae bacterium]
MKLWSKDNTATRELVEQFTVGRDREFDLLLAEHDVAGSLAHTQMLESAGLLSPDERASIHRELHNILVDIRAGQFQIEPDAEDVHSQIESMLTHRIGEAGKKIHTGRSRNDHVAVDIKLYLRAELQEVKRAVADLFDLLLDLSERYRDHLLPGYTHLQIAMPSSFGLWLGAYAESLVDDMETVAAAYRIVNKNPLGSGAGYGSSFPLDRQLTTILLGFETLHFNAVYAQMSRGKTEKIVAQALSNLAATLGRLATDICLYLNQNFGFISFPPELTTGSSIMPHKKNPDVFELIRARCNRISATPNELALLMTNLPSGYHRDLQLTKEILFPAIESLKSCFRMMSYALPQIKVNEEILQDDKYQFLFSVDAVNQLVKAGLPFREAYREVGNRIEAGTFAFDKNDALQHTHEGSIGNLCNEEIRKEMNKVMNKIPAL